MFWVLKMTLNETVRLSTHNICFSREIRKFIFYLALIFRGLSKLFSLFYPLVFTPVWPSATYCVKMLILAYSQAVTYVLGAQKNRLSETVLLSTHSICFY